MGGQMEATPTPEAPLRARTAFGDTVSATELEPEQIHRFILGIDDKPRPMTEEEIGDELNDPFAVLLLRRGVFPTTLAEITAGIDSAIGKEGPLSTEMRFLVGEGSQIPLSEETAKLPRGLRLAVTRGPVDVIDLLISTDASGLTDDFLQVMGWDDKQGVFHYYERKGDKWIWAGNSTHALDPDSRGRGPFDSHVNGSMVMKELKPPWTHWHSQDATVPPEVFSPDDPTRNELPQFSGAEVFQFRVVQPGIRRWTNSRFTKTVSDDGSVAQAKALMEQLFVTTTVNLVSTARQSSEVKPDEVLILPPTFFCDVDTLSDTLQLAAPSGLEISGQRYLDALERFQYALVDENAGFRRAGDTHFAFLVPERAFEDIDVVRKCLEVELLSERFVASALMVDFPNPTFSERRAALLARVPESASAPERLEDTIVGAIEAAAADGTPEQEFLSLWQLGDGWRAEADKRLGELFAALAARLGTDDGVRDCMRLAESRRNRVRALSLSEQRPLLFARTNIPETEPELEMLADATVRQKAQ
jgi:hypothetical protein